MKPLCEVIVQEILPGVRSLIAKSLTEKYNMSQKQAAERMGTTQPAISQYKSNVRGVKSRLFRNNPKIMDLIDDLSKRLASGKVSLEQQTLSFCEICKELRFNGSACELHRAQDPSLETCQVCMENRKFYGD